MEFPRVRTFSYVTNTIIPTLSILTEEGSLGQVMQVDVFRHIVSDMLNGGLWDIHIVTSNVQLRIQV